VPRNGSPLHLLSFVNADALTVFILFWFVGCNYSSKRTKQSWSVSFNKDV